MFDVEATIEKRQESSGTFEKYGCSGLIQSEASAVAGSNEMQRVSELLGCCSLCWVLPLGRWVYLLGCPCPL